MDPLTPDDLLHIAVNKFPSLAALPSPSASASDADLIAATDGNDQEKSSTLLSRMIAFNRRVGLNFG